MTGATGPENRQLRAIFIMLGIVAACAALAGWGLLKAIGLL